MIYDYLIEYFINTKLMFPNGEVRKKSHGIPSGSNFTSLIGSVVNYLAIQTLFELMDIPVVKLNVLGDDGLVFILK